MGEYIAVYIGLRPSLTSLRSAEESYEEPAHGYNPIPKPLSASTGSFRRPYCYEALEREKVERNRRVDEHST